MVKHFDVVIVGAGHGAAQAASSLRSAKFSGSIGIFGDEPELPYERPPLSKEYFAREKTFERLLIRPPAFWTEREVSFQLGERVIAVDAAHRKIRRENGETIGFDSLIWSTGASPRRLGCAGHDLKGVHVVRNRADVDRMIADLPGVTSVVVIGGGYIGLEVASVLTKFGKSVTVLESQNRVLARVAGEELSRFYEAAHRSHGVTIHLNAKVKALIGDGQVTGVRLADGSVLPAEMVVVGIGVIPAVGPLLDAGIIGDPLLGVDVDEFCHTSAGNIYAIGDCARHKNTFADGAQIRLESVQNANDQAIVAAKAIIGRPEPYHAVPWFWSDQFDLRLQTIGLSAGHDEVVVRGDPAASSVSFIYLKACRVIALDCVNATKDFIQGRALVVKRTEADRAALADPSVPLKSLAV